MRKIKIWVLLAVALSICLLTACGGQTIKQSPDISKAFSEESKPEVSQSVIDAMAEYEEVIDAYCKYMDLWFTLSLDEQIQNMDRYMIVNNELARNQEIMEGLLERKDEFNDTDYAYMEQTVLKCAQKLLACANNGLDAAFVQEDQNG